MKYPQFRNELVMMLEQDQREVRAQGRAYWRSRKTPEAAATYDDRKHSKRHFMDRAQRMLDILRVIKLPSEENVGHDGSQAMSVIALHSTLSVMKQVLNAFEKCYNNNPKSIDPESIAVLTDRVLMIQRQKQKFGTQWLAERDGTFFLYPVEDFKHMNQRRAKYGLERAKRPIDLSYGVPKNQPPRPYAKASDQRALKPEEYDYFFSEYFD